MQKRINAKGIVLWKALSTYTTTMYVPLSLYLFLSLCSNMEKEWREFVVAPFLFPRSF